MAPLAKNIPDPCSRTMSHEVSRLHYVKVILVLKRTF